MAMAADQFERYYAEKLWETIPSIYRHEDGIAEKPGVLRAMVQVIAKQAAVLRRSQDHLWDDQFIELCNEWAVPYIGDLVATRLLSALNTRARRIDVAKTIYYRRRKGTPRILEELISDISDWDGKLVEQFQKLGRARYGLDPHPRGLAGRFSGTLPGGWADLRNPRISELSDGPFEEYFHTPDMRRYNGATGRYSIPKLAFYLYRLRAFAAVHITPFSLGDGQRYTFDPSGRDTPLFSQRLRSDDWEEWHSALEWELPAPIPCRLLAHAEYQVGEAVIQQLEAGGLPAAAAAELRTIAGLRFKSESSLVALIDSFASHADILNPAHFILLLSLSLVPDCGKQALLPDAATMLTNPLETSSMAVGFETPADRIISVENITAASLANWTANTNKILAIDAEKGRFRFTAVPDPDKDVYVAYQYGFSGTTGAGSYTRPWIKKSIPTDHIAGGGSIAPAPANGIVQIDDSKTYGPVQNPAGVSNLVIQADSNQRAYLRLEEDWVLDAGAGSNANLVLDGLWIGAAGDVSASVVLRGDYACVIIRNCSFDPGGSKNAGNQTLFPVPLIIEGHIDNLCIDFSIMAPISNSSTGNTELTEIADSIIQSIDTTEPAIQLNTGITNIYRSTIFGKTNVHRLNASELIATDMVTVVDTQNGCFRFSASPSISRLPRPYESYLFTDDTNHWFTSQRFGDPGFAQLSETAPVNIVRGAENGSEMGAFSSLLNPIKADGLRTKIDEYMPFGLIPIFINKT